MLEKITGRKKKKWRVVPWKEGDELPEDAIARARGHLPAWEKELARLKAENERLRAGIKAVKRAKNMMESYIKIAGCVPKNQYREKIEPLLSSATQDLEIEADDEQ